MAFTDFYMDTGSGSNLNAGSTAGGAAYSSASGDWDGTSIFTPNDGSTPASSVNVGDWLSVYPVGNTITPYVAQVTTVAAGANGAITLSTTAKFGTAPTSSAGTHNRSAKAGGSWADLGLCAAGGVLNTGTITQATRLNVKAGTYANAASGRTFGLAGSATVPFHIRGYKTTIGDQDTNANPVLGTDIPQFTWTTAGYTGGNYHTYTAISWLVTGALANRVIIAGTPNTFQSCFIEHQNANAASSAIQGTTVMLIGCRLKTDPLAHVILTGGSSSHTLYGCVLRGGLAGVSVSAGGGITIVDTVFDGQAGDGITYPSAGGVDIYHCSFYGQGGNGITLSGTLSFSVKIYNNHFENVNQAGKAAINLTGTGPAWVRAIGNSYFNCTANTSGLGDQPLFFDNGTLGASGFTAPASHDFGQTTALKAIGFPGAFRGETYTGYADTGAVQRQEPAGGGTTVFGGEF